MFTSHIWYTCSRIKSHIATFYVKELMGITFIGGQSTEELFITYPTINAF